MLKYPKTFGELLRWFPDEKACRDYLEKIRWPSGIQCPRCKALQSWSRLDRPLRDCVKCGHQFSLFSGTIFQDTHLPLRTWFHAIWWAVNQKTGMSALGLQRALGLGSYRTAWVLLHKLRISMVRTGRDRLSGQVEVDEVFLGGKRNKELIGVAVEIKGSGTGRIRMEQIADRSSKTLVGFVERNVESGSVIVTDGLQSYDAVEKKKYIHKPMRKPYFWEDQNPDDDKLLPRVHRVASLLKRWYYGTHQGRIDPRHLNSYLNEFIFRFNRRTSSSHGLLFYRTLENSVQANPLTYSNLTS